MTETYGGTFRTGSTDVEAWRWEKNGDHPRDKVYWMEIDGVKVLSEGKVVGRFHKSKYSSQMFCDECGQALEEHGWIDGVPEGMKVCPSDYVVTNQIGDTYAVHKNEFESAYNLREGYGG